MSTVGGLNAVAYLCEVAFRLLTMLTNSRLGWKLLTIAIVSMAI
jgi:hypothetical protein